MLKNTNTAVEAVKRGYQPVPLVSGDKVSRVSGWTKLRWKDDAEGLKEVVEKFDEWAEQGHGGIGVLLGEPSGGLIDIDLDHPKTSRLRDHFLPPTRARSGRDSRPNTHYWYIAEPGTLQATRTFKMPRDPDEPHSQMIVEYRSTGGQTAIPGNVHPTGERYSWSGKPWGGKQGPTVVDGRLLQVQVALLGFCTLLVNYWPQRGGRHEAYLALAGGLLRVGDGIHPYWQRNIEVVISAIADATNDEDGADARIYETVETTLKRLREGRPAAGFGKLEEILGVDAVRQARVILAEIESAAGLPSRTSGQLTLEQITQAADKPLEERTEPITPSEQAEREGVEVDEDHPDNLEDVERDPLEDRLSTWDAVDVEPYLTGQVQTVEPTVMLRTDSQALMYPGRLNMLYGPSEAAKSWLSMYICIQAMERGERVIYLDFEDEPVNALDRMRLLGASYDDLRNSFKYVRPEDPLASMQRSRWGESQATPEAVYNEKRFWELVDRHDPSIIIADGMTVLYDLHGLDSNDSVQTNTITSWLKQLSRNGRSTVIIVDHTAKNPTKGSMPIGSQHKVSMVMGSLIQTYPVTQPMPGEIGKVELYVLKDRPGKVRAASEKSGEKAQLAGVFVLDSTDTSTANASIEAPPVKASAADKQAKKRQMELDLTRERAAERAEKMRKEELTVLEAYGSTLGMALSKLEIARAVYGDSVEKYTQLTSSERGIIERPLKRLIENGEVVTQGEGTGMMYVLAVDIIDD